MRVKIWPASGEYIRELARWQYRQINLSLFTFGGIISGYKRAKSAKEKKNTKHSVHYLIISWEKEGTHRHETLANLLEVE